MIHSGFRSDRSKTCMAKMVHWLFAIICGKLQRMGSFPIEEVLLHTPAQYIAYPNSVKAIFRRCMLTVGCEWTTSGFIFNLVHLRKYIYSMYLHTYIHIKRSYQNRERISALKASQFLSMDLHKIARQPILSD